MKSKLLGNGSIRFSVFRGIFASQNNDQSSGDLIMCVATNLLRLVTFATSAFKLAAYGLGR